MYGLGLAHLLLAAIDTLAEVCALVSALWLDSDETVAGEQ